MDSILQQITDWLKEMLVSAIMGNLSGMFESVNNQVGEIATSVGMTPANFSPGVFAMVRNISESVIIPIAGLILTFIACYELIQMIIDHNNLANFETTARYKRKRRYHIRKYCHRCFGIGNNGRNADGNGFGSFARLVPAILYRAGHDVRFGNHHLCDRLRSND